uniref:Uncharacterized protein n=1 Tax=Parascaris equorum TaxID=6256 RepID=A0A914SCD9_PAREQ
MFQDALSLQKVVLQKKRELCKSNSSVVNVQSEIRTLLTSLLIAVNNHQGRYRRLDRFQDDLFALFDAARQNSRSDSQSGGREVQHLK